MADVARVDAVVVGAGVVGLAVAARLAQQGREVIVVESAGAIGTGTSSRNSEVIHAGLYYPPGSLKARLCVAGRQQLYDYCARRNVPHRKCGKLVVATAIDEVAAIEAIADNARASGVHDVALWTGDQVAAAEPAIRSVAALHSPETGIVDSHALMLSLQGELEDAGGVVAFNAPVERGEQGTGGIALDIGGAIPMRLEASIVVNAAGLGAVPLLARLDGFPGDAIPGFYLAKGNYFGLTGRAPASRLIYPAPSQAGLGIHLTLDLAGRARFGPDVEWIDAPDYVVVPERAEGFYAAIRRYWPGLPDGALQPDYAGIRAKLSPSGAAAADFMIQTEGEHGWPGLVNLLGIESPGLTASLALADTVVATVG